MSHSVPNFVSCIHNIVFKVWFNPSIIPMHCGWWAVAFNFFIPRSLQTFSIKKATKWSLYLTIKPLPNQIMILSIQSTIKLFVQSLIRSIRNSLSHFCKKFLECNWASWAYYLFYCYLHQQDHNAVCCCACACDRLIIVRWCLTLHTYVAM